MSEYLTPDDYKKAEANGITMERAKARFYQLGWSKRRAITQPVKSPKGLWPKWKDVCAETGVSQTTFFDRIKNRGATPEQAATTPPLKQWGWTKNPHKVTQKDREIAAKNGLSRGIVNHRVYGLRWDVQRAITEPINTKFRRSDLK